MMTPFLDGELPRDECELLERHLAECPACAKEMASLRATAGMVRALPKVSAPEGMREAIRQRLDEPALAPVRVPLVRRLWPAAAAAAIALAFYFLSPEQPRRHDAEPAPADPPGHTAVADPDAPHEEREEIGSAVLGVQSDAPPDSPESVPSDAEPARFQASVRAADPAAALARVRRLGEDLGLAVAVAEGPDALSAKGEARLVRAWLNRVERAGLPVHPAALAEEMPLDGLLELTFRVERPR